MIRWKCSQCKKVLAAKETQAGRKTACPNCKTPVVVPKPKTKPSATELDALAAKMLGDDDDAKPPEPEPVTQSIKFTCEFCDGPIEVPITEAGKKIPCPDPECRRIVRVPVPDERKPKDWRDIIKKGPSAALVNLPEQLENAWGTEQKSRVSASALEEAGAGPDLVVAPVGIGVWIKRAFWSAAIVGLLFLAVNGARRNRTERQEREAIDEAVSMITPDGKQPAKVKLSPAELAEIHRAAGELYCAKRKTAKAKDQFRKALAMLQLGENPGSALDDLLLIDLALAEVELGGSEDEAIAKEKIRWPEVQKEIGMSLDAITAEPARLMGMRLVASRLWEKKQAVLAISLAGQAGSRNESPGQPSPLVAQQVALLLARKDKGDEAQAAKLLARPKTEKAIIDPLARAAYAEGLARQGNFPDALEMASAKSTPAGPLDPQERMEACVGAAMVILADRSLTKPAAEALPFVQKALLAHADAIKADEKYQMPPWLLLQMAEVGAACESAKEKDACADLAKKLEPSFAQYVKLMQMRADWLKANAVISDANIELDAKLLPCPLAWESLARTNARLGASRDEVLGLSTEPRWAPFLLAGFALGKHDRDR